MYPMRPQAVAYGGRLYKSLLARRWKPVSRQGSWAIEPKLDGMRLLSVVTSDGVRLLSRTGNLVHNVDVGRAVSGLSINWLSISGGDSRTGGFVFDGELFDGKYHIFDAPCIVGDYAYRRAWMDKNVHRFRGSVVRGMQLTCEDPWKWVMDRGHEGLVFKYIHSSYSWNKSPSSPPNPQWMKVKP